MTLQDARYLAMKLMDENGLKDYLFTFDTASRRFGCCNYKKKLISLSQKLTLLNNEEAVKDTILHEIAHALVGPGHGHDHVWVNKAVSIGCDGKRCYDPSEVVMPKRKYKGECPKCKRVIFKHRRSKTSCGKCASTYTPELKFIWSVNE